MVKAPVPDASQTERGFENKNRRIINTLFIPRNCGLGLEVAF
jgi:hypothetical protein